MADAATANYDVTIEDAGPARKRLSITVPSGTIDEKLSEAMTTLASQTQLKGFRKGRAPIGLLERRFGTDVRTKTREQLIADGYAAAIEEHHLKPVSEPEPVGKIEDIALETGKPFTFSVVVEVLPEFELPDLSGVEIRKPVIDVVDEHIDGEISRQCIQFGDLEEIQRDFRPGDRLLARGTATREGDDEPFFRHDRIDIAVPDPEVEEGRGAVLGLLIDRFAGMLDGKRVGDHLTIETIGPESHELDQIRGKKLVIELDLHAAARITPATVERVVEQYGLGTTAVLREQVRLALENRRNDEQRAAMREQLFGWLANTIDFALPEKLTARQTSRLVERQRYELFHRGGLDEGEVERRLAEVRAETEAQSRHRLKLSFIMHRLGEHFQVQVTDQEINGRIAAIAMARGVRPEQLRSELIQSGAIAQIATQLREHKAADRVIDQAKVVDVPAAEWNKQLLAERAEARRGAAKSAPKKSTTKKKTGKAPAVEGSAEH